MLDKQQRMDSSGIRIPPPTGDTLWGSSGAAVPFPGGIVGPLCTSPLKTGLHSAEILPPTATTTTNTRTYCCLIIGMFTQLAAATAAKGTQRATRGGAFCKRRKKGFSRSQCDFFFFLFPPTYFHPVITQTVLKPCKLYTYLSMHLNLLKKKSVS